MDQKQPDPVQLKGYDDTPKPIPPRPCVMSLNADLIDRKTVDTRWWPRPLLY